MLEKIFDGMLKFSKLLDGPDPQDQPPPRVIVDSKPSEETDEWGDEPPPLPPPPPPRIQYDDPNERVETAWKQVPSFTGYVGVGSMSSFNPWSPPAVSGCAFTPPVSGWVASSAAGVVHSPYMEPTVLPWAAMDETKETLSKIIEAINEKGRTGFTMRENDPPTSIDLLYNDEMIAQAVGDMFNIPSLAGDVNVYMRHMPTEDIARVADVIITICDTRDEERKRKAKLASKLKILSEG